MVRDEGGRFGLAQAATTSMTGTQRTSVLIRGMVRANDRPIPTRDAPPPPGTLSMP